MANEADVAILKQGVEIWNKWKTQGDKLRVHFDAYPTLLADLSELDLSGQNLMDANFDRMDLRCVNFSGAKLIGASFLESYIQGADFTDADLRDTNFGLAYLGSEDYVDTNTSMAYTFSSREGVNLPANSTFEGADLSWASFDAARLHEVNFKRAKLFFANFREANVKNTNFDSAAFGRTIFARNDLSTAKGLDQAKHSEPSYLDIESIYLSKGRIPEEFLRGVGIPDTFITYIPSLANQAIEFHSCFISYSNKDQNFAEQLYTDLQNRGIRCWFAPKDLKIGDRFRQRIDDSIRVQDKLLVILSESSISSDWVEYEVEAATERDRLEERSVLFPIRIDDSVMNSKKAWATLLRRQRHIGDFTGWERYENYSNALDKLIHDLKA
jgi:uncharacterized protein YjbI with pentapeptide repeats